MTIQTDWRQLYEREVVKYEEAMMALRASEKERGRLAGELAQRAPPGPPPSMTPGIERYRTRIGGVEYDLPWQVYQELQALRDDLAAMAAERDTWVKGFVREAYPKGEER